MKKILIALIFLLTSSVSIGQSEKKDPNIGVIRLVILNDNNEVLIKKSTIGWITIDTYFNKRQTINEVINSLSKKYGVLIDKPQLKGLFTYKFSFKNSSSVRQIYVAKSQTNDLPTKTGTEFHWVSKNEAIKKLKSTVPSLGAMIKQILENPESVWGGSFLVSKNKNKLSSSQIEDFYKVSEFTKHKDSKDYLEVEKTLQKYMNGSSYSKQELIRSAFTDNATLYLTGRDGEFKRYTPVEYASFFKNRKKGEFNGRNAKVLAIEVIRDIATAKVEIAGTNRKWVYIDLFLLKKIDKEWKIISKTATRVDDGK